MTAIGQKARTADIAIRAVVRERQGRDTAVATRRVLVSALLGALAIPAAATDYTATVTASSGQVVTLNGDTVTVAGGGGTGLHATGAGAQILSSDTAVQAGGNGALADLGGYIRLTGGSAAGSNGVRATGAGSLIEASGTAISGTSGARAENGASVSLANLTVATQGTLAVGLTTIGQGSTATGDGLGITTQGMYGYGVNANAGTAVTLSQTTITTAGDVAYGLLAVGSGGSIVAGDGTTITTTGANALGALARGGSITLSNGSTTTQGTSAPGLAALGAGSQLSATQWQVRTTGASSGGNGSYGAYAVNGGLIALDQATIATQGDLAAGLFASGAGSQITASATTVTTSGSGADGVQLVGGSVSLSGSTINAAGNGVHLGSASSVSSGGNLLQVMGGRIESVQGSALYADAGSSTVTLGNGAQLVGGNGIVLAVRQAGTSVDLTADGNVSLTGDIDSDADATANVHLANGSVLTGAATQAGLMDIDASSTWNLTGNADVRSLALAGTLVFTAPNDNKTLVVHGDLAGANGTVVLNTLLNEGGPLASQSTDRVLVEGNASGTTFLKVVGSGTGALTSGEEVPAASQGISLVQVAGPSAASAFQLQGGYVAVGPWRYNLYAYQPGSADAAQRLVAGSGNGYWDYRLQSAYVSDPAVPPEPEPPGTPEPPITPETPPAPDARPEVVPQVPAYVSAPAAMLAYGARQMASLHDRLGEFHQDSADGDAASEFYARVDGGNYTYKSNLGFDQFGYGFTQIDRSLQLGGTLLKAQGEQDVWRAGLFGSTGNSSIVPDAADGGSRLRMNAASLGATVTYMRDNGLYVDGVVSRNYYDARVDTDARGTDMARIKAHGWSYSLESGYALLLGPGLRLEPQAQVIYQRIGLNRFSDADGLDITPASSSTWIGRVGANLGKTFTTASGLDWTAGVRLNYLRGSGGTTQVDVTSRAWDVDSALNSGRFGDALQGGLTLTGHLAAKAWIYLAGDYQTRLGDAGEKGWSANVGLRWQF